MDSNKHKAIILVNIEVHEVLQSGEMSGKPVGIEDLKKFNLTPKMLLSVEGFDKFECLRKLKEKIDGFKF